MKCVLPRFLNDEFLQGLRNASRRAEYNFTDGPGVAAFIATDNSHRFDVFAGLQFDGYLEYKNLTRKLPDIKFEFKGPPTISCPSDVIDVDPEEENTIISIKVGNNNDNIIIRRCRCSNGCHIQS